MKNTIIYIDGGNLYYGQLRGSANKWLDLEAFSAKLLNPDHAIAAVKYFTSRVIDCLIASHAQSRGLTLITNNTRDFERVPGLRIENWAR